MTKEYEALYEASTRLIDSNPNLTTAAIPDILLKVWIYNGRVTPNPPFEMLFAASIYKYANDKYGDTKIDAAAGRLRFERLQHILAVEYACRKVGAKLRPRRIFDFARDMEPLNIDIKRNQMKRYQALCATLVPIRNMR